MPDPDSRAARPTRWSRRGWQRVLGPVRRRVAGTGRGGVRGLADLLSLDGTVLVQAFKIGLSASLAWALALWWLNSPSPIWAPITASLIALLTVRASVGDALQRLVAVLIGILVAIWLGGLVGLHVWSIGVIVTVGFLAGRILRLSPGAAAQIPINGLFVLVLGGGADPGQRYLDTVVGAAVAVAVNLLIVPPNLVDPARRSTADVADGVVAVLGRMSTGIARPWTHEEASGWLATARQQRRAAGRAENDVADADQSLRLHPNRAAWTGALDRVRQAADTLIVVDVQVRVLARTLRDTADRLSGTDGRQPPYPMASALLATTAGAIEAFAYALLAGSTRPQRSALPPVEAGPARRGIVLARETIAAINADLSALLAANLERGVLLGALIVETERILDELETGLDAAGARAAQHPADGETSEDEPSTRG
ncbi:FUSC family protein [Nakamurella flava]|uniref:FUSC family protein n=1 Tax=Nakamurella flava TaxID=2576308 RepID=UPI001409E73E|nr:FUSC family protein [Nakamurella flava]